MKQNKQNTRIVLRLLSLAVLLSFFPNAFGQEYIKETSVPYHSDTSIVRQTSRGTVMIYNRGEGRSSFLSVVSGDNFPYEIHIAPLYVNDFEVFEKMIYFCGYKYENNDSSAIFGFFKIDSFPNNTVYYYEFPICKELKKIEAYKTPSQFNQETHLVMTGAINNRSDMLVDMNLNTPAMNNCEAYISQNEKEYFDDIAVTSSRIVVSSRTEENNTPIVNFWQYVMPTTAGQNIFLTGVDRIRVNSPVADSPVWLEHTNADNYAASYKESGYYRIILLLLDVSYNSPKSIDIFRDSIVYPMEIKYLSGQNFVYDILAKDMNFDEPQYTSKMKIYHITSDILSNYYFVGHGTWYPDSHLWSIEPVGAAYNSFVVSGYKNHLLRLSQYRYDYWLGCPSQFDFLVTHGIPTGKKLPDYLPMTHLYYLEKKKIKPPLWKIEFPVICGNE